MQGFRGVIDKDGRIVPNPKGRWYQREPRNHENCLRNHQQWDAGVYEDEKEKNEKLKEKYYSNKHPPLKVVDCPDDTNYIEIFAPPVLHDLLGKIFCLCFEIICFMCIAIDAVNYFCHCL